MTLPDAPEDAPSDSSDRSYERTFAELFRRFWRSSRTETPPSDGQAVEDPAKL